MNHLKLCLCALLTPLLLATPAMSAMITWGTPLTFDVTQPSQVFTDGTLVVAASTWPASAGTQAVVNGVTFDRWLSATNFTPGATSTYVGNEAPGEYGKIVNYVAYLATGSGPSSPSVFSGLIIGQQYKLEIWTPYFYTTFPTQFGSASDGSQNSPTLINGVGYTTNAPQYIFGTFTATATTQNLYQFGTPEDGFSVIGAVELRAVPEPQTWALAALGASAVLFRLRRKSRLE